MTIKLALALLLAMGCVAPDYRGVLTSKEAESILAAVPVLKLLRPPNAAGNAVVIGERTIITVAHAATSDDLAYLLDDQFVELQTVAVGVDNNETPSRYPSDWRITKVVGADLSSYQPLEVERDVSPGSEIFLVGYWTAPEARGSSDDRELVAVRGRVIDPPFGLGDAARGLICVDLGRPPDDWSGLSGAAAVVRTNDGFKLVGILAGHISYEWWPAKVLCIVPIPDLGA